LSAWGSVASAITARLTLSRISWTCRVDVDAKHLVAFLKQGGGEIETEISQSDHGKLLFHFFIRS
jgi:hypothetical protein